MNFFAHCNLSTLPQRLVYAFRNMNITMQPTSGPALHYRNIDVINGKIANKGKDI